jgi:hypothetical protein
LSALGKSQKVLPLSQKSAQVARDYINRFIDEEDKGNGEEDSDSSASNNKSMNGSFQHNYSFEEEKSEDDSSESIGSQHVYINKRSDKKTAIKVLITDDCKPNIVLLRETLKQYQ